MSSLISLTLQCTASLPSLTFTLPDFPAALKNLLQAGAWQICHAACRAVYGSGTLAARWRIAGIARDMAGICDNANRQKGPHDAGLSD